MNQIPITNLALRLQRDIYMLIRAHDGLRPGEAMWLPEILDQLSADDSNILRLIHSGIADEAFQSLVDMGLIEEFTDGSQRYRLTEAARGLPPLFAAPDPG